MRLTIEDVKLKELTGIFKDLKFGDVFILKNEELLIFEKKPEPWFDEKKVNDFYKNAKTILDLGEFHLTENDHILRYNSKGIFLGNSYSDRGYDIKEKLIRNKLEIIVHDLITNEDPTKETIGAVKKIIEFFDHNSKDLIDNYKNTF